MTLSKYLLTLTHTLFQVNPHDTTAAIAEPRCRPGAAQLFLATCPTVGAPLSGRYPAESEAYLLHFLFYFHDAVLSEQRLLLGPTAAREAAEKQTAARNQNTGLKREAAY